MNFDETELLFDDRDVSVTPKSQVLHPKNQEQLREMYEIYKVGIDLNLFVDSGNESHNLIPQRMYLLKY